MADEGTVSLRGREEVRGAGALPDPPLSLRGREGPGPCRIPHSATASGLLLLLGKPDAPPWAASGGGSVGRRSGDLGGEGG